MTEIYNAGSNLSEKKMEGEDSVKRTLECLRGRLLAERMVSRNANNDAHLLSTKLVELEKMIKEEAKSRKRAERKLGMLMKKLKSINISYVSSDGSEQELGLGDKSDISSVTSTSKDDENIQNQQIKISSFCQSEECEEADKSQKSPLNLDQIDGGSSEDQISIQMSDSFEQNVEENTTVEDSLNSVGDVSSEKSSQIGSNQSYDDSKMDQLSDIGYGSVKSSNEDGLNQEDNQDPDQNVDNSMALVLVDTPEKIQTVDPDVLDATVKEVLDSLRHVKEQLQSSMERKRANMIRVG